MHQSRTVSIRWRTLVAVSVLVCHIGCKTWYTSSVVIKSTDPSVDPAIHPNYLSTVNDQQTIVDGLRLSRKIMATPTMKKLVIEEFAPGPATQTDEQLLQFARDTGSTVYHPVSTCKMGPDSMAVVDERLRVHGMQGLRVVDASIMPTLNSGNTNAPTIMIAEKAADMILQDRRSAA